MALAKLLWSLQNNFFKFKHNRKMLLRNGVAFFCIIFALLNLTIFKILLITNFGNIWINKYLLIYNNHKWCFNVTLLMKSGHYSKKNSPTLRWLTSVVIFLDLVYILRTHHSQHSHHLLRLLFQFFLCASHYGNLPALRGLWPPQLRVVDLVHILC